MTNMTAVLAFQFLGWPYQPPAGDQTCFGYGTLPPPPILAIGVTAGSELRSRGRKHEEGGGGCGEDLKLPHA